MYHSKKKSNISVDEIVEELTKMLIKQDFKDKEKGIEYIKIPKIQIIKQNIKLLKYLQNFK